MALHMAEELVNKCQEDNNAVAKEGKPFINNERAEEPQQSHSTHSEANCCLNTDADHTNHTAFAHLRFNKELLNELAANGPLCAEASSEEQASPLNRTPPPTTSKPNATPGFLRPSHTPGTDRLTTFSPTHIAQYDILRSIGSGSSGRVLLAHDTHRNACVAIKAIPRRDNQEKPFRQEINNFLANGKTPVTIIDNSATDDPALAEDTTTLPLTNAEPHPTSPNTTPATPSSSFDPLADAFAQPTCTDILLEEAAQITQADARTFREVIISALIDHPNIPRLLDFQYSASTFFLVFAYIPGVQLYDLVARSPLDERHARAIFQQILSAVEYAHRHSIAHRDLKIENILIDEHGRAHLIDFGLANFCTRRGLMSTFCGSLYFAAPELLRGQRYHGLAADVWSLGVVLHVMLSGRVPFDDASVRGLQGKIRAGIYTAPAGVSTEAATLLTQMLRADPMTRAGIQDVLASDWVLGRMCKRSKKDKRGRAGKSRATSKKKRRGDTSKEGENLGGSASLSGRSAGGNASGGTDVLSNLDGRSEEDKRSERSLSNAQTLPCELASILEEQAPRSFDEEAAVALCAALAFQFPTAAQELRCWRRKVTGQAPVGRLYWEERPSVVLYKLLVAGRSGRQRQTPAALQNTATEQGDGAAPDVWSYAGTIYEFVRFVLDGVPGEFRARYYPLPVLKESGRASGDQKDGSGKITSVATMFSKDTSLLWPRVRKVVIRGLFGAVRIRWAGSANGLKKLLLDVFAAEEVAYVPGERSYYCTSLVGREECEFKVTPFYNVLLRTFGLWFSHIYGKEKAYAKTVAHITESLKATRC